MRMFHLALALSAAIAAPASAQEYDGQYIGSAVDMARDNMAGQNTARAVRENNGQPSTSAIPVSRTRATCDNARRMAADGRRDPKLSKLLQVCAQGGW